MGIPSAVKSGLAIACIGFVSARPVSAALDCSKLTEAMCKALTASKSDADTFSVTIAFYGPPRDPACRNVDPRTDTTGKCGSGWDSTYRAKLKTESARLFTDFELFDSRHPEKRLPVPAEAVDAYTGIMATRATLIRISVEDEFVSIIEPWTYHGSLGIRRGSASSLASPRNPGTYLINGKSVPAVKRMPSLRMHRRS
jgi:hypothetical protein